MHWHIHGPLSSEVLEAARRQISAPDFVGSRDTWRGVIARGPEARVEMSAAKAGETWLAFADVDAPEPTPVQFLSSGNGPLQVWLNGRQVFDRNENRAFAAESDRFEGTLSAGLNRIVVQIVAATDKSVFHLRFRRKSSTARHEQLTQAALSLTGDSERGRKLFFNAAQTQCVKCHRIGNEGERIGPELTGLGDRFSRIHIVESILDPSRTVTPGFQTLLVRLIDGRTISGIKIAENERTLTLADQKGEKHTLEKSDIEAQQPQTTSTMPDNLAQQFTNDQFVDLITFLVSQKQARTGATTAARP